MFIALAALAWWHPLKYLQSKRYFEDREGVVASEKGAEKPIAAETAV
jgi:hypothetical protein